MTRLIDADALKEQFSEIVGEYIVSEIISIIDNAPAVPDRYDEGFRDGYAKCFNDREERKENFIRFLKGSEEE